jgi:hypothetical protein
MASNTVDDIILRARDAAFEELRHMLSSVQFDDMTTTEAIAFISLLRPTYERVQQEVRNRQPPAEIVPLKLVGRRNRPTVPPRLNRQVAQSEPPRPAPTSPWGGPLSLRLRGFA